ncbi:MAG: tetratricopeptide repeat protein [Cyclobacteriaceae bacterium]
MQPTAQLNTDYVVQLLEEAYSIRINNLQGSMDLTNKAMSISEKMQDNLLIAKCTSRLSLYHMILGEYELAIKLGTKALPLFEKEKYKPGIAEVKYNIAGVYYKTDKYHQALVYLIDCLSIFEEIKDMHNQARVHKSLGTIYEYFGDEKSAVFSYERAIFAAQKVKDLNLESNAYNPLSGIYLNKGNVPKATELIERSIAMKNETGDTRGLAFAIYGKAKIYAQTEQFETAKKLYQESLNIHEEMGERLGRAMVLYKLGVLYIKMDMLDKAEEVLNGALKFSTEFNIVIIKFKCYYHLYEIFKQRQDHVQALEYLETYLSEKESVINSQTRKIIESYEALTSMERLKKEAEMQREKAEILEKKNLAEESSRVRQEFLSTMSHEIRTPLNAVITITSLLEDKSDNNDDELLKSLKFSSNNLLRIINDILDFSKLDAGKVLLEPTSGDFLSLLENIRNTYKNLASEKGIRINLNIENDIKRFYKIDETKITQILGNLVSNAIKFTDKGEVSIDVTLLRKGDKSDQIEISISDTGIGIVEGSLNDIFDSFSQSKSYTTRKHQGTGLGLAIVKKLVTLHGSNIEVESTIGKGSRFFFQISLPHGINQKPDTIEISDDLNGKTVLMAEDNMINAMVSIRLLSKWGLKVEHAKDGLEAVELSSTTTFDFILMDIHMPNLDGFDATRSIRASSNPNCRTPIYALTADITASQRELFSPYFDGFLLKPIEIDKLFNTLTKKSIK